MRTHGLKSPLTSGLCMVLSFWMAMPPAIAQNVPANISLQVVEGEGATNSARQRVSRDPVVKLEDDDHRPVAGAAVVFSLPVSGASGEFLNGSKNLTAVTDENGLASAHGLKTNDTPGKMQIYVSASYRGRRTRTLINQFVKSAPGARTRGPELRTSSSGGKWKWVILGVAAAGGAGAGMYFKNRNSTPQPISINAGTAVFGSPR